MCSSRVSKPTGMSGSEGQFPVRCETTRRLFTRRRRTALRGGLRGAEFRHLEALQDVADFHVVEVGNARAALETGAHLAGVVLEAFERAELRRVGHRAIPQDPNL